MTVPSWALCSCTTAPEPRPTSATLPCQLEQEAQPVLLVPRLSEKGLGFIDTVAVSAALCRGLPGAQIFLMGDVCASL